MHATAVDIDIIPVVFNARRVVERAPLGRRLVVRRIRAVFKPKPVRGVAEHVVDEAAVMVAVSRYAQREFVFHQRNIEYQGTAIASIAVAAAPGFTIEYCLKGIHDRLVGDNAHGAGLRIRAVQGALRSRQRFDTLDIDCAYRRLRSGLGNGDFVEIYGRSRLAYVPGSGAGAAEHHLARGSAVLHHVDGRNKTRVILHGLGAHRGQ